MSDTLLLPEEWDLVSPFSAIKRKSGVIDETGCDMCGSKRRVTRRRIYGTTARWLGRMAHAQRSGRVAHAWRDGSAPGGDYSVYQFLRLIVRGPKAGEWVVTPVGFAFVGGEIAAPTWVDVGSMGNNRREFLGTTTDRVWIWDVLPDEYDGPRRSGE